MKRLLLPLLLCLLPEFSVTNPCEATDLRIAEFDIDVTPPIGFAMAYDDVERIEELGLRCRGVVILGAGRPVALCAVDWIGIGNGAYEAFRDSIAEAAGTEPERVAVHTLHQHDAPRCDFTTEQANTGRDTRCSRDCESKRDSTRQPTVASKLRSPITEH